MTKRNSLKARRIDRSFILQREGERKARAMTVFAYFAGALLAGVGAYRVGGWLSSLLPGAPAEEAL